MAASKALAGTPSTAWIEKPDSRPSKSAVKPMTSASGSARLCRQPHARMRTVAESAIMQPGGWDRSVCIRADRRSGLLDPLGRQKVSCVQRFEDSSREASTQHGRCRPSQNDSSSLSDARQLPERWCEPACSISIGWSD